MRCLTQGNGMAEAHTQSSALARLVESSWFRATTFTLILCSAAILGLETSPAVRNRYGDLLHVVETSIVWMFALELALRIGSYGKQWGRFFLSGWNVFDAVVVAMCFLPAMGQLSALARLARILRALRVVSYLPNLQLLVEALIKSFRSMGYVALMLSMVFYVYGVIGVGLFSAQDAEHFGGLGAACLTLFQILTLEGWVDVMEPQRSLYPIGAPLFFVSFILLGTMIVLNLFIGVIVNGMSEAQSELLLEQARAEGDEIREALQAVETQLIRLRSLVDSKQRTIETSTRTTTRVIQSETNTLEELRSESSPPIR